MSIVFGLLGSREIDELTGAIHGWATTPLHLKSVEPLIILLDCVEHMQAMVLIELEVVELVAD